MTIEAIEELLSGNKNVSAFLTVIGKSEGAAYDSLFGDTVAHPKKFTDFSKHPDIKAEYTDKSGKKIITTATGRYQINFPTWKDILKALPLKDFSPHSQDIAAVYLLSICGALPYVEKGDLLNAVAKASAKWASLPGANVNQPMHSYTIILDWYKNAGGIKTT